MRLYLSSYGFGNKPEELLNLLNGKKRTAHVMNAADMVSENERDEKLSRGTKELESLGLEPTDIDLRKYFGKQEELKQVLSNFDLIWVRGGNSFVLCRALKQSGADVIIKELLQKDAVVYGGYSAGAVVLAPSLHGTELVDDPHVVPPGYDQDIIWDGLDILPYSIEPHYKSDHPESAAMDKSVEYLIDNHILFKALRDGEVIVVNGNSETVVG